MKAFEPVREEFVVPLNRDESASIEFRKQGNLHLKQGKLFEALESFNKSLCTAHLNSKEIPLAFAGRSSVYLDAQEYEKCLENLNLARDYGFPAEKISTLNYLEEKCKKLMKDEVKSDDDDPWTFFKLSYPPNEKIPFIANCLELHNSSNFGRLITASQGQFEFWFELSTNLDSLFNRFTSRRYYCYRRTFLQDGTTTVGTFTMHKLLQVKQDELDSKSSHQNR